MTAKISPENTTARQERRSGGGPGLRRQKALGLLAAAALDARPTADEVSPDLSLRHSKKRQTLARAVAKTGTSGLVRKRLFKGHHIEGVGTQSFVLSPRTAPDKIVKYDRLAPGELPSSVRERLYARQAEYEKVKAQFGDLVWPTSYEMGRAPVRLGKSYQTVVVVQDRLPEHYDVFGNTAKKLIEHPSHTALRDDVHRLVEGSREWAEEDEWLDLIGPKNVVATKLDDEWRLRIVDPEMHQKSRLDMYGADAQFTNRELLTARLNYLDGLLQPEVTRA